MLSALADRITYFWVIRTCWRFSSRPERRRLVLIYVLLTGSNAMALTRPVIIGKVVTTVATGGPEFHRHLVLWLAAMVGSMVMSWVFVGPARIQERKFGFALRQSVTERLYGEVTALPWEWHQAHHTGDTLSRITTATKALFAFADNQFDYMNTFLKLAGCIGLLLWFAPEVGLVIAAVTPPLAYIMRRFDLVSMRITEEINRGERTLAASLMDYLGNIATLLALRIADAGRAVLHARFAELRPVLTRAVEVAVYKSAFYSIALSAASAPALLFYLSRQSDLTTAIAAGTVVTVFQYLQQIDGAIGTFAGNYQTLLNFRIDVGGIDDIRNAHAEQGGPPRAPHRTEWKELAITGLRFRYEDREHHVHQLEGIALVLRRGGRVALVGSSGSGKSTLLRLLRGLHEPESATLTLDGLFQPDFGALAAVSTLIPQDAEIFENTLRYNVAFGTDANDAELQPAIEMACLGPVIAPLPQGLDTDIRERGVNLSGGQKQRLALARGLFAARGSSLLLMDEPTSSLDPITEVEIFTRIFAALPDTCIVAAIHRLHLLDRFDYIYVMENGGIIEEGTLPDLLARNGAFAALWAAQRREEQT